MSWSASFLKPVPKRSVDERIDLLTTGSQTEGPAIDQLRIARQAAKLLVANLPGPYIMVSASGHANGVGWQKKEGWSNDSISITVTQFCDADMDFYNKLSSEEP